MKNRVPGALVMLVLLAGCSAHNPLVVTHQEVVVPIGESMGVAHDRHVQIIESPLPAEIDHERLAEIDVGRVWYAGRDTARIQLANAARKLGADAVIDVRIWYQPSGFAWAAPHARGIAVRWNDAASARGAATLGPAF